MRDFYLRNRSDFFLFLVLFAFVVLVRMPAHYQISIDDIGKLASATPYPDLIKAAGTWNRFSVSFLAAVFDLFSIPFSVFMFGGSILADAILVVFCIKLTQFFDKTAPWFITAIIALCIGLMPYFFILFHFHVIGMSLVVVFGSLIWILMAADSKSRWALPVAIIVGGALLAGAYQSALYWYALTILAISLRDAIQGLPPKAMFRQLFLHAAYMAAAMVIYAILGKVTSMLGVPPKHSFATWEEMKTMLDYRLSWPYFKFHLRNVEFLTKSLKILVFYHAMAMLVFALILSRKRLSLAVVTVIFLFAILMCSIQILMFPYNYTHVPVRSFWWYGLFYGICALVFYGVFAHNRKTMREAGSNAETVKPSIGFEALIEKIGPIFVVANMAVVTYVAISFTYATYNLGLGLNTMRTLDKMRANYIAEQLDLMQFQYDRPIVLALGGKARVAMQHEGTIGATKTLFWAGWTRIPYMSRVTGKTFKKPSADVFNAGREICLADPPIGPMPTVTLQADYVLVCI